MFSWLESKIYVRYWTCFCNPPHSFDSKTAQTLLIFPDTFLLTQDLAKFTPIWLVLPYGKSHWFQNRHFLVVNLAKLNRYRASFRIFKIILDSQEEKNFTIESKDKGLSLCKFSWYLVVVKIIKIRHSIQLHFSRIDRYNWEAL